MIIIAILLAVFAILYLNFTKNYSYWAKRGVKHEKPTVFVGNMARNYLFQKSLAQIATELYFKYPDEKMVGYYTGLHPTLLIRDPELIKRILTTDFLNFTTRGMIPYQHELEPLLKNVLFAEGDDWRVLRTRLTPTFTSAKLRAMFPLITKSSERLYARLLEKVSTSDSMELDAREYMARFTMDFIGSCGFGIETDTLTNDDSEFYKMGIRIYKPSVKDVIVYLAKTTFPRLFQNFKLMVRVEKHITDMVNCVIKQRNYKPSNRHDFLDLLLELRNQKCSFESIEKQNSDGTPVVIQKDFDDGFIPAQAFLFIAAGFETSSSTMSFALHFLAYNLEVQKKAQADVDRVLALHDNKLSYDCINEMTYLKATIHESMRRFPGAATLIRMCTRNYTIPDTDVQITPGVQIHINLNGLNNDPKYFDNPSEFRPERFLPENAHNVNNLVFQPFGKGPRNCMGGRLGMMQSMAGLAAVLSKFTVHPGPNTKFELDIDPRSNVIQNIIGGIPLIFKKRST